MARPRAEAPRCEDRQPYAVATPLLVAAQVLAWIVVRRWIATTDDWSRLALQPSNLDPQALIVAPFIHLDPAHLGVNLLVLWLFGANLERSLGSPRFLVIYLGAGFVGSLMQWATALVFHAAAELGVGMASLGSSGAVAGVLGAVFVRFPQARLNVPFVPRATFPSAPFLTLWLAYTVVRAIITTVNGASDGIGHWAHFAGFVFGTGAALLFKAQLQARVDLLHQSAQEAVRHNNLPAAAQAWAAILAVRPGDRSVRGSLISARLTLGDRAGARRIAREGIVSAVRSDDRTAAISAFLAFSPVTPDLNLPPGVRYQIATWLTEAGEHDHAYRAFLDSLKEDGSTTAAASSLFRAGEVAWQKLRQPARAHAAWARLLREHPDSAWSDRARALLGRLDLPPRSPA